ncbi:dTDP-4-dehydrorhamnose reductase [Agitococcus lubricus]|uniref:dTDP-4-dehydrorhamnose reductase n=1 Tax=Agitococcus lubricus TaxID=1077255 RepID=A0A2T5J0Y1_9GAMM|nr:dTDP-4-dehydrorhamnose reductase [Agitococcus lubricus]PTQ90047.1 dTDP-4-dehydrorhamnose reductase [Agitococcus lubricus]
MTILLLGQQGQVGWELKRSLLTQAQTVYGVDRRQVDLSDMDAVLRLLRTLKPTHIINAAAYTAVDLAETESEMAYRINATLPQLLAEEAKTLGASLIHYSTDYVFDGSKKTAYIETDSPNPLNVYGQTKLAGEQAIQAVATRYLILRTSWVYGERGKNFFLTMQRLLQEKPQLRVVADQVGAPTWSRLIAQITAHIMTQSTKTWQHNGIYHLTSTGDCSWYEFAQAIADKLGYTTPIIPISTDEYPTPAQRPRNSCLATTKLQQDFVLHIPHWRWVWDELVSGA